MSRLHGKPGVDGGVLCRACHHPIHTGPCLQRGLPGFPDCACGAAAAKLRAKLDEITRNAHSWADATAEVAEAMQKVGLSMKREQFTVVTGRPVMGNEHDYVVPVDKVEEFYSLVGKVDEFPPWAERIQYGTLVFPSYRII